MNVFIEGSSFLVEYAGELVTVKEVEISEVEYSKEQCGNFLYFCGKYWYVEVCIMLYF